MRRIKWTQEVVKEKASKFNTRQAFKINEKGAYNAACLMKIMDEICAHMKDPQTSRQSDEKIQKRALKYTNRTDYQNNDASGYQTATQRGILDQVCAHMAPSATAPLTLEEIETEAKKFKTRKEFQRGSSAYKAAWRRGILDQVCAHMPKHVDQSGRNNKSFKWENYEVQKEALKFDTRMGFKFGSPKAYDVAVQRKILDEVCSHMKKAINVSTSERELFDKIKEFYPSTTTFRLRNVNIPGKPHIKGLYLDIFIPELKRGIEFDGTYWHSLEGLKRSRKNWPEEDLLAYHDIKDNWFASKHIQILHIRQEDWNLDKEACVEHCLNFLAN